MDQIKMATVVAVVVVVVVVVGKTQQVANVIAAVVPQFVRSVVLLNLIVLLQQNALIMEARI
jgi:hypothetical protein